ncbi:unnamed protein product [Coregonus sp. 'balchen']|nr:unnamed protein product [Coregonus sp. 'balchen']
MSVGISVTDVECVREGLQSETLRQLTGSVPEGQCLTVVFKGARKSLDLRCQTDEEAQRWARGIRTLQERVENMTQKEKLDKYPLWLMMVMMMMMMMMMTRCFLDQNWV